MPYLTELHAHTSEVSPCSHQTAEQVADRYIAEGYTTVVVANHYCDYTMDPAGETWEERLSHYLTGYQRMKAHAQGRLIVILGMELRFVESSNDYLVFGMDEEFLRTHPDLHRMNLKSFSALARENGLITVQAHPFRNGMKVMNPDYLDGYEVFNGHFGHDSRNRIALEWCRKFGKIPTSGSDFHDATSLVGGGIITNEPVTSMKQLTEILQSGDYILHCSSATAEREQMRDVHVSALSDL